MEEDAEEDLRVPQEEVEDAEEEDERAACKELLPNFLDLCLRELWSECWWWSLACGRWKRCSCDPPTSTLPSGLSPRITSFRRSDNIPEKWPRR